MLKSVLPVKGFRDLYPEEMAFQNWLFAKMRKVSTSFGYEEYEGPILEPVEIYEAKSSKELVKKQTFQLTDKGGRKLALRPELTPTLARMVAAKQFEIPLPIRWFSIGPRFRYETPQKGRAREFYQWDIDLVGIKSPEADAEIIAIACRFFQEIGLTSKEVIVKINNRKLMELKLSVLGFGKNMTATIFNLIDKKNKMDEKEWVLFCKSKGLDDKQIQSLKYMLGDRDVAFESEELTETLSTLKDLDLSSYIEFDPSIVRGLEYYTGTVFEASDRKRSFRAILGGGRYDNLVEIFGGKEISGVGFACGDMVIKELLKYYGKMPEINPNISKVLITVFNDSTFRNSLAVFARIQKDNLCSEIYPTSKMSLDKQLKYADKKGIPFAVIIGPEEVKTNKIQLKNLRTKEQKMVSVEEAIAIIGEQ